MSISRRNFLTVAGFAPIAMIAVRSAANTPPVACYDPATLPLAQRNLRRALEYVETSADTSKTCGQCAFFVVGETDCGTCQMMNGGPVNAGAYCASFARRP